MLALLSLSIVLASASASLTWVTAKLIPAFSVSSVEATGLQLMPAFAAVVLFGLAAVFVLWYSKVLARRILCALMIALFGSQFYAVVFEIILSPSRAFAGTSILTEVTGVGDETSRVELIVGTDTSVAAWVCAACLLLVVAICLVIAFQPGAWLKINRRIEKNPTAAKATEPIDLWDAQA